MFVSLFTCRLLYVAHTGKSLPGDMPFAAAATFVNSEVHPAKFARMVAMGQSLIGRTDLSTEQAAEYVRLAGAVGTKMRPEDVPPAPTV